MMRKELAKAGYKLTLHGWAKPPAKKQAHSDCKCPPQIQTHHTTLTHTHSHIPIAPSSPHYGKKGPRGTAKC
jgi:hypothetical protein